MKLNYDRPTDHNRALLVRISGAITALEADQLWKFVSREIGDETRFVVLNFTRVTMLTSAGIGILVRLYTRLKGYEGGLAIFGCTARIREIFAIVMLTEVLKVCDNEAQAWDALNA